MRSCRLQPIAQPELVTAAPPAAVASLPGRWWDVLAVLGFTVVAIFALQHDCAGQSRAAVPGTATMPRCRPGYQRPRGDRRTGGSLSACALCSCSSWCAAGPASVSGTRFTGIGQGISAAGYFSSGSHSGCRGRGLVALSADSQVAADGQVLQRRDQRLLDGRIRHYRWRRCWKSCSFAECCIRCCGARSGLTIAVAADGSGLRRHSRSATGLCLGAHPQHLRGRRGASRWFARAPTRWPRRS